MYKRKSHQLVSHFLRNSPASQLKKYRQLFKQYQPDKKTQHEIPSNTAYLQGFLHSVQVFGTPISMLRQHSPLNIVDLQKIFVQNRMNYRSSYYPPGQVQQILQCIRQLNNLNKTNLSDYQQLEQRIVIAQPETIHAIKVKLIYLFKILLNKRNKLKPKSLELDANVSLSESIVKAFTKQAEKGQYKKALFDLQNLQKLFKAREHKKNGCSEAACNSLEEIFRDSAVAFSTRLEALKGLCQEVEELRDVRMLESLMSLSKQKGQKQYEQYLRLIIDRIKKGEEETKDSK